MSISQFRMLQETRESHKSGVRVKLRCVRPSLMDPRFQGDACIVDQGNGLLALRLGDYNLTQFLGLPVDLPSLNQRLDQVWNRRPRATSRAKKVTRAVSITAPEQKTPAVG